VPTVEFALNRISIKANPNPRGQHMQIIGIFRKEGKQFTGSIVTLTLDLRDVTIGLHNGNYVVTASRGTGRAAIGRATFKIVDETPGLDVVLDDPFIPTPIPCRLAFVSQGYYSLIWERKAD
jgi:uncharacterized protein (DUF736 family)